MPPRPFRHGLLAAFGRSGLERELYLRYSSACRGPADAGHAVVPLPRPACLPTARRPTGTARIGQALSNPPSPGLQVRLVVVVVVLAMVMVPRVTPFGDPGQRASRPGDGRSCSRSCCRSSA